MYIVYNLGLFKLLFNGVKMTFSSFLKMLCTVMSTSEMVYVMTQGIFFCHYLLATICFPKPTDCPISTGCNKCPIDSNIYDYVSLHVSPFQSPRNQEPETPLQLRARTETRRTWRSNPSQTPKMTTRTTSTTTTKAVTR